MYPPPQPRVRQRVVGSMERNVSSAHWEINLPNDTLAHNNGLLFIEGNSGVTITAGNITDNQGGTWEKVMNPVSSGQSGHAWRCADLAAGVKKITVVIDATDQFMQFNFVEMAYLSTAAIATAMDGTATTVTAVTSGKVASAAITVTDDNSAVFMFGFDQSQNITSRFQAGPGWKLLGAQLVDGICLQYCVPGSNRVVVPVFYRFGTTSNYNALAFAIKPDSTKGDHRLANGKIAFIEHHCPRTNIQQITLQFPCEGNCIQLGIGHGALPTLVSITDSMGNAYSQQTFASDVNQHVEQWLAINTNPANDLLITLTWTGQIAHGMVLIRDIVGAAPQPIGVKGTSSGSQASAGDLSTGSFTPQAQESVIILDGVIFQHTAINMNGGAKWYADMMSENVSDGADISLDEADLWGHYYNGTDVGSATPSWVIQNDISNGVLGWLCGHLEIMSAPSSDVPRQPIQMAPNVRA